MKELSHLIPNKVIDLLNSMPKEKALEMIRKSKERVQAMPDQNQQKAQMETKDLLNRVMKKD